MNSKKIIRVEDLPIEQQLDIILNSDDFWEYVMKNSEEDYSLESILRQHGITDEKVIVAAKAKSEIRRKLFPKKYRLLTVDE